MAQQNYYTCSVVVIAVVITLACCESVRRAFPANLILMAVFTVAEGFMLGVVAAYAF